MEQVGEVTAVRNGMLEITFCRPEECEKCHGCAGHHKPSVIRMPGEAKVGDAAVVSMPDNVLVKASLLGYILPIAGLLIGMVIAYLAFANDYAAAIGGVAGLGLALLVVLLTEKKRRANADWQPKVTKIIPRTPAE